MTQGTRRVVSVILMSFTLFTTSRELLDAVCAFLNNMGQENTFNFQVAKRSNKLLSWLDVEKGLAANRELATSFCEFLTNEKSQEPIETIYQFFATDSRKLIASSIDQNVVPEKISEVLIHFGWYYDLVNQYTRSMAACEQCILNDARYGADPTQDREYLTVYQRKVFWATQMFLWHAALLYVAGV